MPFHKIIMRCHFCFLAENAVSSGAWGVNKIMSLSSAFPIFEDGNKENYG